MSIKIKPLFIQYKSIPQAIQKGVTFSSTPLEKRKGGLYSQIKQARGVPVWDLSDISAHHREQWEKIEKRLLSFTLNRLPGYTPRRATMASAGDKLSGIRHDLKMSILFLMQSYAKKEWSLVASYSSAVNTHYLTYHIAVMGLAGGGVAEYYNKSSIHCDYHPIPREERNIFGRRKKQVSK